MTRLLNAWGALGRDRRLAAISSLGLFVSMLLPWYSKTVVVRTRGGGAGSQSLNAFQAFSFVEAAVLLVSAGVLALLFARAEELDFHLPGGDGTIVMLAGAWTAILVFYRLFDKQGLQRNEQVVASVGVQWGIFVALLVALGLAYVGRRMRFDERAAPPLARVRRREDVPPSRGARAGTGAGTAAGAETVVVASYEQEHDTDETVAERRPARAAKQVSPARAPASEAPALPSAPTAPLGERRSRGERPRYPPPPAEQMSFEDAPSEED
jgi:hypothetical protein